MSYFIIKFIYIILFIIIFYRYKLKYILYKNYTRYIKDILFIYGYDIKKDALHYKYRILNQIEELNANFYESDEYFFLNFEPNIVSNYRVIIFSGCSWTEKVEKAIILSKNLNKKILFDMDDFFIIKKYNNKFSFVNFFSINEKEIFNEAFMEIFKIF